MNDDIDPPEPPADAACPDCERPMVQYAGSVVCWSCNYRACRDCGRPTSSAMRAYCGPCQLRAPVVATATKQPAGTSFLDAHLGTAEADRLRREEAAIPQQERIEWKESEARETASREAARILTERGDVAGAARMLAAAEYETRARDGAGAADD